MVSPRPTSWNVQSGLGGAASSGRIDAAAGPSGAAAPAAHPASASAHARTASARDGIAAGRPQQLRNATAHDTRTTSLSDGPWRPAKPFLRPPGDHFAAGKHPIAAQSVEWAKAAKVSMNLRGAHSAVPTQRAPNLVYPVAKPDRVGTADPMRCLNRIVGAAFAHPTVHYSAGVEVGRRAIARSARSAASCSSIASNERPLVSNPKAR
jgi:hypothetical protein